MSVILKGYKYKILESYNNNGNSIEVTEADELETAIELDEFLECVKSYRDDDIEKLKKEFPDWADRIERLSAYMASTGKTYKNHLATIRNWARRDRTKPAPDIKPSIPASYDLEGYQKAAMSKPLIYSSHSKGA